MPLSAELERLSLRLRDTSVSGHVLGTGGGDADDEGWLLSYLHDEATDVSRFVVLDATDIASGPVASVALPQRVPYGFHGTWVADPA